MRRLVLTMAAMIACTGSAGAQEMERFETGQWERSMQVRSIEGPAVTDAMRRQMLDVAAAMRGRGCMGGAIADTLRSLRAGMVEGLRQTIGGDCDFSDQDSVADGAVRLSAICRSPRSPAEMAIELFGTYDTRRVDAAYNLLILPANGGEAVVHMQAVITMERLGPC